MKTIKVEIKVQAPDDMTPESVANTIDVIIAVGLDDARLSAKLGGDDGVCYDPQPALSLEIGEAEAVSGTGNELTNIPELPADLQDFYESYTTIAQNGERYMAYASFIYCADIFTKPLAAKRVSVDGTCWAIYTFSPSRCPNDKDGSYIVAYCQLPALSVVKG